MNRTTACFVLLLFMSCFQPSSAQVTITNPILAGYYPDPSICRVGKDYYLVNSSFSYYPGLLIFHSTDLVNWQPIGAALNRPEQLDLSGLGVSMGLFAPTIRYHNGLFYLVCTLVGKQGNFVVTAKNPSGPWSNPVWLPQVHGIDPSLFFDDKAYIVFNSNAPDNKPLYQGHTTIRLYAFDEVALRTTGEETILVNGGTDITKKPIWIEGPHLYKKDGYYYLLCAQGGTEYNHSEVIFRSKSVDGPYESYRNNPVLTQRQLSSERKNPITSTGHADMVSTPDGRWYAVFLGCRPYSGDYYNTGRETFMVPMQWKDGWPEILAADAAVPYAWTMPGAAVKNPLDGFNGNYYFRDAFKVGPLNMRYSFLRTVTMPWYTLNSKRGGLDMLVRPQTCSGTENPSFIGFRQAHAKGQAAISLTFAASAENEKAGLLIFQNENHYYFLCQSVQAGQPVLQLYKGPGKAHAGDAPELLASKNIAHLLKDQKLKIMANGALYSFYYSDEGGKWVLLKGDVDAKFLSTAVAGGFVGCMYALYATSSGKPSFNKARFNWFEYKGDDDVFKK